MDKDRGRKFFIVIGIALVAIIITSMYAGQKAQLFGGEFDKVGIYQVKGEITRVKSFQESDSFKFLVEMRVDEIEILQGNFVGGSDSLPKKDDLIRFDSPDSRMNLIVKHPPECHVDGAVKVCTYLLETDDITKATFAIMEVIGSTGHPEPIGSLE